MANVWKIAPGTNAKNWDVFRERGCIGLGWAKLEDYQTFRSYSEVLPALKTQYGPNAKGKGRLVSWSSPGRIRVRLNRCPIWVDRNHVSHRVQEYGLAPGPGVSPQPG